MASTGQKKDSLSLVGVDRAFGSMSTKVAVSAKELQVLFSTIAAECETNEERGLFLQVCKARGLNPFKGEVWATKKGRKLVFLTSYYVAVSRARQAGYLINGAPVFEKDDVGTWDTVECRPSHHRQPMVGDRGACLGGWVRALPVQTPPGTIPAIIGQFIELHELVPPPLWKTGGRNYSPDGRWAEHDLNPDCPPEQAWRAALAGAYGPFWQRAPGRAVEKCLAAHIGRRVAPDLESLYIPEELTGEESKTTTVAKDVFEVEAVESKPAEPEAPAEEPVVEPEVDQNDVENQVMGLMAELAEHNRPLVRAIGEHYPTKPLPWEELRDVYQAAKRLVELTDGDATLQIVSGAAKDGTLPAVLLEALQDVGG
jgi:hypothetical protein